MKTHAAFKVYSDKQAKLTCLKGKTISVLGYGNQGRAQALNLRDSGLEVIIGLPPGNKDVKSARRDEFRVASTESSVRLGDIISVLAPDHLHGEIYKRQIERNLNHGKILLFASALSIQFGLIVPPNYIDVIMVAPHAPGAIMRNLFMQGKGVPCFIAVKRNISGDARKIALAYAKAIGCTKAGVFETTFEHEAIGDLFGEQAILCGGVPELLKAGFEVLVKDGLPPENAYLECIHQLDFIVNTIKSHGIAGMFNRISKTAEYGSYLSGKRIINQQVKKNMSKILQEIRDGSFVKKWMREYRSGMKNYRKFKTLAGKHPIEKTSKRIRKYSE